MERLTVKKENGYTFRMASQMPRIIDKLGKFEDAEEQGLLLRLPCKVGDTIYQVNSASAIDKHIVTAIGIYPSKVIICTENYRTGIGYSFDANRIGKRYFLTQEEAEQALKQMGE